VDVIEKGGYGQEHACDCGGDDGDLMQAEADGKQDEEDGEPVMGGIEKFAVEDDEEGGGGEEGLGILHELGGKREAEPGREQAEDERDGIGGEHGIGKGLEAEREDEIDAGRGVLEEVAIDGLAIEKTLGTHPEVELIAAEEIGKSRGGEEVGIEVCRRGEESEDVPAQRRGNARP